MTPPTGAPSAPPAADTEIVYDVALSFAGRERGYVEELSEQLRARGLKPFYDNDEQGLLMGRNLATHLDRVYRRQSRLVIIFISASYKQRLWTKWEYRAILTRMFEGDPDTVIPARFDDTELEGLPPIHGYIDLRATSMAKFADMIHQRLMQIRLDKSTRRHIPRWLPVSLGSVAAGAASGVFAVYQTLRDAILAAVGAVVVLALWSWMSQRSYPWWMRLRRTAVRVGPGLATAFVTALTATMLIRGPVIYPELTDNGLGTPVFLGPGTGQLGDDRRIPVGTWVDVSCKVRNTTGFSSVTYWYRIESDPWRGLYAPSDTFANGDIPRSGGPTKVDARVPDC